MCGTKVQELVGWRCVVNPELKESVRFMEAYEMALYLGRVFQANGAFRHLTATSPKQCLVTQGFVSAEVEHTDFACNVVNMTQSSKIWMRIIFSSDRILILDHEAERATDVPRSIGNAEAKARVYGVVARLFGFDPLHPVLQ